MVKKTMQMDISVRDALQYNPEQLMLVSLLKEALKGVAVGNKEDISWVQGDSSKNYPLEFSAVCDYLWLDSSYVRSQAF